MVGHTGEHCRQLQYLPCMGTEGTVTAFSYIITNLRKYPPPSPILPGGVLISRSAYLVGPRGAGRKARST